MTEGYPWKLERCNFWYPRLGARREVGEPLGNKIRDFTNHRSNKSGMVAGGIREKICSGIRIKREVVVMGDRSSQP